MVDAATDPAVGLATGFAPPLGCYDPNNGEVAGICSGRGSTVGHGGSYVVQLVYSNLASACVDH